jgi:iron complex outermembrane receptor protein
MAGQNQENISLSDPLDSEQAGTASTAIRDIPGVFSPERSPLGFGIGPGGAGGLSIRGFNTGQRTLFLRDGRPDAMGIFGHGLYDAYTTESFEKMEGVRGADSVRYGGGAIGGSVNMISRRRKTPGYETALDLGGGSFGTRQVIVQQGGNTGKGFDYYLAGGFRATDGHRVNSAADRNSFYTLLGWKPQSRVDVSLAARHNDSFVQDPGSLSEVLTLQSRGRKLDKWSRCQRTGTDLIVQDSLIPGDGSLHLFMDYGHNVIRNTSVTNYYWDSVDRSYGGSLSRTFQPLESLEVQTGYDLREAGGSGQDTSATPLLYPTRTQLEQGIFVLSKTRPWERLETSAGARLHHHQEYGWEFLPQTGFDLGVSTDTHLKGSVSKGFRSPTVSERLNLATANRDLGPERAWTYETGVVQQIRWVQAEVTGFYIDGSNLIRTEGVAPALKYQNSGAFIHRGIEASVHAPFSPLFDLSLGGTWQDPGNETNATPLRRYTLSAGTTIGRFSDELKVERVEALFGSDYVRTRLPNYTIVGLSARYRLNRAMRLYAEVHNLFNQYYELISGYAMPGRWAMSGIEVEF